MKTARERAEEKRAEKLERVREQLQSGSLVIRQMTEEERRRYPQGRIAAEAARVAVIMPEQGGLIARIRHIRRAPAEVYEPAVPSTSAPGRDELHALEARIAHLEQVVQGLQDSVHRESTRLTKRIAELETRTQPAALGKALSKDARKRGL